jgi:transposase
MKAASQEGRGKTNTQKEPFASVEEWRPDPGVQVARTIATRRGERDARYQQAVHLHEQGRSMKAIASRLCISQRTVRHCPNNAFVDELIPKAVPEPG